MMNPAEEKGDRRLLPERPDQPSVGARCFAQKVPVPFFPPGNFPSSRRVINFGTAVNDDARLIAETLAGTSAAFGQLVLKYQDRLFNTLVHVVGSREDARDVVQDAFVQAFVNLRGFQQTSAFYTWLYRIAFNVAASLGRRRKPVLSIERARDVAGQEPVDGQAGPSQRAEQQERCRQVQEAIAALSEEHRAILVLREIDGCCYETIGQILDLPIGTVRSRLHRARLQLKDELKEVLVFDD
jgi:RNA polymerase sigma-70 factor, ECF subfamily